MFLREGRISGCAASTSGHQYQYQYLNKQIGGTITKLQLNNELVTGETDTNWVTYLPDILELVNENADREKLEGKVEGRNLWVRGVL